MNDRFHVLIVGAGNIGAFYDKPGDKHVLSHAHAFTAHPAFTLAGFTDSDMSKAELAAQMWGGKAYTSLREAFQSAQIDIVCVAAPDEWHYSILKEVAMYPVKLVFAEKPLTKTMAQAEEIIQLYRTRNMPILVHYIRRFVPEFENLRKRICAGEFGALLCGTGYYGKGILHNGSHMIDFLLYLLDETPAGKVISKVHDYYADDPSVTAALTFSKGAVVALHAVDCRCHTIFELDLLFEQKRLRITDVGFKVEEYELQEHGVFTGYRTLEKSAEYATQLGSALENAVLDIFHHLTQGKSLSCTADDACSVMAVCLKLREETI